MTTRLETVHKIMMTTFLHSI